MRANTALHRFPPLVSLAVVLGLCVLFKWRFAEADALTLEWILRPTSALVSLVTGMVFVSHGAAGYYNDAQAILIAPACSGLNFFIILLATGGCLTVRGRKGLRKRLPWFAGVLVAAFAVTLAVNTVRILAAIFLYHHGVSIGPLGPEQIHRIEGVIVYYVCLCGFALAFSAFLRATGPRLAGARYSRPGLSVFLPLGCYLLFTLGIPLANGAAAKFPGAFAEHSLTVLLLSLGLSFGLYCVYRKQSGGRNAMTEHGEEAEQDGQ